MHIVIGVGFHIARVRFCYENLVDTSGVTGG
jgi:hypothetical protein